MNDLGTFTCAHCGKTLRRTFTKDEFKKQAQKDWVGWQQNNLLEVCTPCFDSITAPMRGNLSRN